ncbi:MAG: hypothetical protein Q7K35_04355 [bacterium]|nr:hypothetical protein [bacterium]
MKKLIFIFFIFVLFLLTNNTYAAPAVRGGIAINPQTKECAGYWVGDENTHYDFPSGWKSYSGDYVVTTEFGTCNLFLGEEKCCDELRLTFVSLNIGWGRDYYAIFKNIVTKPLNGYNLIVVGFVVIIIGVIVSFLYYKKRKS